MRSSWASFVAFATDCLRATRAIVARATIFIILGAFTEGLGLILLLPLVNVVSKASLGNGWIDTVAGRALALLPADTPLGRLGFLLALFAAIMAIRAWSLVNRDVLLARLQTDFIETLRVRIVDALAHANWTQLTRLRHGRVGHILSNDIGSCGLAAQLTLQSAVAAMTLGVQVALALALAPAIAAIVLVLLAGGALTLRPALRRSRQLGTELVDANLRLTDGTGQFLNGLKLAFSQNLQAGFAREFRQTVNFGARREVAFARQRSIGQVALTTLAAAVAAIALLLGFSVFATSPASLIAMLIVLARMTGPAAQLQQNLHYIAYGLPAYEHVRALERDLHAAADRQAEEAIGRPAPAPGDIVFAGVTYRHDTAGGGGAGISDIDLTLHAGEIVGITGASGAGKTTLLDLLAGLLAPDAGSILIDGTALTRPMVTHWQDRLSYVAQDPYLFNDSIAGNLRWARSEADDSAMRHALALAQAGDLVAGLPEGIDTLVGERGTRLSGGERQRIALARALIREPQLLILDEATNAIDVAGEQAILEGLRALRPRPTIVIVAHRDQSLAFCDRIIALENGRLVDRDRSGPV